VCFFIIFSEGSKMTSFNSSDSISSSNRENLTAWSLSTLQSKSIEEVEIFVKNELTGRHCVGWHSGLWTVYTDDGLPPAFVFTLIPNRGGQYGIDLLNACVNNIVEIESRETSSGCWSETEWPEGIDQEELASMEEEEEDEDYYDVFENHGWSHEDTQMWVWGQLLIEGGNGFRQIVACDNNGATVFRKE
jgi:hypothetical protein